MQCTLQSLCTVLSMSHRYHSYPSPARSPSVPPLCQVKAKDLEIELLNAKLRQQEQMAKEQAALVREAFYCSLQA